MKRISLIALILAVLIPMQGQAQWGLFENKKVELKCENLRDIKKGFLIAHINTSKLTPTLEARLVKQYIENLDPMKVYFTQKDVNQLTKEMKGVFNSINKAKCDQLFTVQEFYRKKVQARVDFAKDLLSKKGFKFDKTISIMLDPKKRGWAKDLKALQVLQAKYVHFQISNRLITDKKLPEAIQLVKRSYDRGVRNLGKQSRQDVLSGYLNSFAHALDPHTSYFSAEVLEDFEIQMSLELQGIGATLTSEDGFTVVDSLVKGGAAEKSDEIFPKDKIIAVAQFKKSGKPGALENVVEWELRDVVRKIRGKKGSKVQLKILRKNKGKVSNHLVTLVRDKIQLEDDAARLSFMDKKMNGVQRKIGIIHLPSFYADSKKGGRSSAADVKKLIQQAKKKKVDGLVLDMANNGGGSLSDAVELAGLFFRTGNVVKQSSKNPRLRPIPLKDVDAEVDWTGPLVVLTNLSSASASEIVAGTLKDYQRAVVVGGPHTFGKGSVQQVIPLAPGLGALKVTVGMFFTPGGFSTQHRGVEAHITFPSAYSEKDYGEKTLDYSLPPKKIASFLSPSAYVEVGKGAWKKVDAKTISTLNARSQKRIKANKDFQKIIADRTKADIEDGKPLVLGETFDDRKDKNDEYEKKKNLSDADKLAEFHKRPDVIESVNILTDLIDVRKNVSLKVAGTPKPTAADVKKKTN